MDQETTQESLRRLDNVTVRPETAGPLEQEIDRLLSAGPREHPLHVLSLDDVVRKHLGWLDVMPRVAPFYAVKCNDDPAILATLASLGTGFDCASEVEMRTVLALGVSPDRILFAHPIKSPEALAFARARGIRRMTFDNECELEKVHREYGPEAQLVLRIRHDSDRVLIALGKKFGCDARGDGRRLLDRAQELGVAVIGVSFHVGCGSLDADCFYRAIESASAVFVYARERLGLQLSLLDIGGGFPGDRPIDEYAHAVQKGLRDFFPDREELEVIAEPGRYYVGSAVTLLTTVQGKRVLRRDEYSPDSIEQIMYYINDGVFGTLFDWLSLRQMSDLDRAVPEVFPGRDRGRTYRTTIWGPTCDSTDIVCEDVDFPEHHIGDCIVFRNLGAYGMTFATNFNGFPKPTVEVYVRQGTWKMLNSVANSDWRVKTATFLRSMLTADDSC